MTNFTPARSAGCLPDPTLLIAVLCIQAAVAQTPNAADIHDSELDFYLIQAFDADTVTERLALNHIGIQVALFDGSYLVTAALEGYPAHLAGIQRGDRIMSVNGQVFHPVYSFNSPNSGTADFSPVSSGYEVEFSRRGIIDAVQLTPVFENLYDSYRSSTLASTQIFSSGNKTVGYIRLWGLSRSTADLFTLEKTLRLFNDCDGLIIDLRNSYGYLSSKHIDMFVRSGRGYFTSSSPSHEHSRIQQNFVTEISRPYLRPLAVLINSETRAGAELLAYGLSKVDRVITLGESTAGEIGNYRSEPGNPADRKGGNMHYSRADQPLIDGKIFEAVGVNPEETVPYPFEQSSRSDPQFETALSLLLGII